MNLAGISLDPNIVKAIKELGYTEFTPIQLSAIPEVQKGKDLIAQSSTGSGKTAAFGLPILEKIQKGKGIQALILTPTRELCVQVADSLEGFAKYAGIKVCAVYGGVGMNPQIDALRVCEVVVATPGRLLDHHRSNHVKLDKVKFFVLDEADRMCDMGFYEDIEKVTRALPDKKQVMLFSATITRDVDKIVSQYMRSPVNVAGEQYVDASLLQQVYYDVSPAEKFSVVLHLLKKNTFGLSLVFCGTRREVDIVTRNLQKQGLHVMAIHGGLTQAKRLRAIELLKHEHIDILVATDVAARGLDIKGVSYVYNWDVPPTPEEYIHRVGRTARAGKNGLAITLLAPHDHLNFRSVLRNSSLNIKNELTPQVEPIPLQRRSVSRSDSGDGKQRGRGYGHSMHGTRGDARGTHSNYSRSREGGESHGRNYSGGAYGRRPSEAGAHNQAAVSGLSSADYRDVGAPGGFGRSFGQRGGSRGSGPKGYGYSGGQSMGTGRRPDSGRGRGDFGRRRPKSWN